jgi:hypothetical protein
MLFADLDELIDLMGNASYEGATGIVLAKKQLRAGFFDLSTRIAGEILQKFSNYRMKLSGIGDFSNPKSKSLRDFIYESNKYGLVTFVSSYEEALKRLS